MDELIIANINALHEQVHDLYGSWHERSGLPLEERSAVIMTTLATELAGLLYYSTIRERREEALEEFSKRVRWVWGEIEKRGES